MYIFTYSNTKKKMSPVSPPVMINVKLCTVREVLFVFFQWWHQKKRLATTALTSDKCRTNLF
jgi:hypothetical protein